MKLWHSFLKELKLSSRSYYFYIEIVMAVIFLLILLFVVPNNFNNQKTEYIYLDMPEGIREKYVGEIEKKDLIRSPEEVMIKADGEEVTTTLYETEERKLYLVNKKEDAKKLAKAKSHLGAIVTLTKSGEFEYTYYLQGYESERLKNLYLVFHQKDFKILEEAIDNIQVQTLSLGQENLSDKENMIPVFLLLNGSIMGMFIIAAYVFLDKQEGIIKAYAVTASSVWQYLVSKIGVLITTSILTCLIMLVPVMGAKPHYLLLLLLIITTSVFSSAIGLIIASFYDNIMQAFGMIYVVMVVMMLPVISYFIPSWDPSWMRVLPAYPMLQAFKEIILQDGDVAYVVMTSGGFLILGTLLFFYANYRYKKTLTV